MIRRLKIKCPKCGSGRQHEKYIPPREYQQKEEGFRVFDFSNGEYLLKKCTDCGFDFDDKRRPDDWEEVKCFYCKKNCFDFKILSAFCTVYVCYLCTLKLGREKDIFLAPMAVLRLERVESGSKYDKYSSFFESLRNEFGDIVKGV